MPPEEARTFPLNITSERREKKLQRADSQRKRKRKKEKVKDLVPDTTQV